MLIVTLLEDDENTGDGGEVVIVTLLRMLRTQEMVGSW